MDCYCDYDVVASVYVVTTPKAKKQHKCIECHAPIMPGETYERVFAVWDGDADNLKTCCRCLALREWVKAHVPCFCWYHHNMIEDAIETARHFGYKADVIGSGFLFGTYRRQVAIERHQKANRPWNTPKKDQP